jgi:hypothetical protein
MAKSTAYGFEFKRHLTPGTETPATLEVILANDAVVAIGEGMLYSSGYLGAGAADKAILGILVGIVTEKGENVFKTQEAHGGTISGDDTFTAGAANATSQKVKGVVIVDQMALFQATNADSLTQAEVGLWFDGVANTNTGVDGTTGSGGSYSTGTQQFQLIELVTLDDAGAAVTDQGLFRIGRSQLINDPTA